MRKLFITSCVIVTAMVADLYGFRFVAAAKAETPSSSVQFIDVTSQAGVAFRHYNGVFRPAL